MKPDPELLKKFTTSELMREVRRRQVKKSDPEKRSETAKNAAIIRWAKKKGKDILGGNVAKLYLFALIQGLLATQLPNT